MIKLKLTKYQSERRSKFFSEESHLWHECINSILAIHGYLSTYIVALLFVDMHCGWLYLSVYN